MSDTPSPFARNLDRTDPSNFGIPPNTPTSIPDTTIVSGANVQSAQATVASYRTIAENRWETFRTAHEADLRTAGVAACSRTSWRTRRPSSTPRTGCSPRH